MAGAAKGWFRRAIMRLSRRPCKSAIDAPYGRPGLQISSRNAMLKPAAHAPSAELENMTESRYVACPACLTQNRIPADRLRHGPKCGKCQARLFGGRPVPLTAKSFDTFLKTSDIPIVVDFWAPWCGPCKAMAPAFEQAAGQLEPAVVLAKVDTEAEPSLGQDYGIRSIPTIVMFYRGKEVARHSGALGTADILRWVSSSLSPR